MQDPLIHLAETAKKLAEDLQKNHALATEVERIFTDENAADRRAGVDFEGRKLAPISPRTYPRRRAAGRGNGPRLCPGPGLRNSRESRVITQFEARRQPTGSSVLLKIRFGFFGMPWLKHHLGKSKILGLSRRTEERIGEALERWSERLFSR